MDERNIDSLVALERAWDTSAAIADNVDRQGGRAAREDVAITTITRTDS